MVGVGRTVFIGTRLDEFKAHILGVLENAMGPSRNLILAKLEGGPLAETGVIAGMSGSPVYIDGRLVGAVSYQLGQFPTEAIAGITPIAEMTDATALAGTRRAGGPVRLALDRAATPAELLGLWRRELGQAQPFAASAAEVLVTAAAGALPRQFATDLRPISVPLVTSGFAPGVLDGLAPDQRDVMVLRIVADLTIEQVAEVLGKRVGAVKALQRRALENLRKKVAPTRTPASRSDDSDE